MTERTVAEQLTVSLTPDGGKTWRTVRGALGWGSSRPFEMILGFGGPSLFTPWVTWVVDVSVAVAGIHCPREHMAGRGDVQIYRDSATTVAVLLHGEGGVTEAIYPADVFGHFVSRVTDLYEEPAPVSDDVLAAHIEDWSSEKREDQDRD